MFKPTALDIDRFTYGDCHVLAQAFHRLTGWKLAAFECGGYPDTHAFVIDPQGRCWDVHGPSTQSDLLAKWKKHGVEGIIDDVQPSEFKLWGIEYGVGSYSRAGIVARRLLDAHNNPN